jgi:zinc transporter ZupT
MLVLDAAFDRDFQERWLDLLLAFAGESHLLVTHHLMLLHSFVSHGLLFVVDSRFLPCQLNITTFFMTAWLQKAAE